VLDPVTARVPAEFVGIARQFRTEVRATDEAMEQALDIVTAPLRARLARHPKLRIAMLADTARRYAELTPARFRIGKLEAATHKTDIALRETRLVSLLSDDHWSDPTGREQGLSICTFVLSVHKGQLRQRWVPLVAVSLHALARRVERHRDRSHEALERDLAYLAGADEADERVDAEGGFWLGEVVAAKTDDGYALRIRNVRTWIGADG
jgi:hypothetical protein